jgi:hypothetical protein
MEREDLTRKSQCLPKDNEQCSGAKYKKEPKCVTLSKSLVTQFFQRVHENTIITNHAMHPDAIPPFPPFREHTLAFACATGKAAEQRLTLLRTQELIEQLVSALNGALPETFFEGNSLRKGKTCERDEMHVAAAEDRL